MEHDKIAQDAKRIMDSFMSAMGDIQVEEEFILERDACFREEGEGLLVDDTFKKYFLANAPKVKGDAIVTRKGDWV